MLKTQTKKQNLSAALLLSSVLCLSISCNSKKQDKIDALNEQIAQLQTDTAGYEDLQLTVESLESTVNSQQLTIDSINGTIEDKNTSINTLESAISANETNIENLNNLISALNLDATSNIEKLEQLAESVESLTETNASLSGQITAINYQIEDNYLEIADVNTELARRIGRTNTLLSKRAKYKSTPLSKI